MSGPPELQTHFTQTVKEAQKNDNARSATNSQKPETKSIKTQLTDEDQYDEFLWEENEPLQIESGRSFPISGDSKEAEQFDKALPKIMEYLDKERFPWQSVNCMGRVFEGPNKRIRSTVVIGASTLNRNSGEPSIPDLRLGVQKAGRFDLPVEFVMGDNELQSHFGFKELKSPLVCGASCGSVTKPRSSGTIGGFITVKRNSDEAAVYAMSNHHVFVENGDRASRIDDQANGMFARLLAGLERLRNMDRIQATGELMETYMMFFGREKSSPLDVEVESIRFEILSLSSSGDTGQTWSLNQVYLMPYVCFWRVLFTDLNSLRSLWRQPPISETAMNDILRPLVETLLREPDEAFIWEVSPIIRASIKKWKRYIGFGSSKIPQRTDVFETILRSWDRRQLGGRYGARREQEQRMIQSLCDCCHDTEVAEEASFLKFLFSEDPDVWLSSKLIEHPSKPDRQSLVIRLEKELVESQAILKACKIQQNTFEAKTDISKLTAIKQDISEATRDVEKLEEQIKAAKDIRDTSSPRLLGFLFTSSGLTTKPDPNFGGEFHLAEDWALVQLFPEIRQQAQNTFDQNILRPSFSELGGDQAFKRVRPWYPSSNWIKLRVFKRGRTTDYTIGFVNGSRSARRLKNNQKDSEGKHAITKEFNIISSSTNGLFSQPGDSGSWIMDKQGQFVGMVWGKLADGSTAFTPADYIFKWIRRHFKEQLKNEAQAEFTVDILK